MEANRDAGHQESQVCEMCSGNVGTTVDGELFVACNICAFPVCRPCYEYKRKYGNQSCPQCQTRYKRHKGSPPIHGYEVDVGNADDLATDFNYSSGNQDQKQKITERILSWHMAYERGEDVGASDYGKEVSHNHIPSPTNGHEVSSELSSSSPECLSMASPEAGVGKPMHPLLYAADVNQSPDIRFVDPAREFGSPIFGNVAWKEDFDSWKANQEKNIVSMNTSHDTSEVSSTDMVMDDSLL